MECVGGFSHYFWKGHNMSLISGIGKNKGYFTTKKPATHCLSPKTLRSMSLKPYEDPYV